MEPLSPHSGSAHGRCQNFMKKILAFKKLKSSYSSSCKSEESIWRIILEDCYPRGILRTDQSSSSDTDQLNVKRLKHKEQYTVKPVLSGHSKRPKFVFQTDYCLMQVKSIAECFEHSAILLTFIKLPFVFKTFDLSMFDWPLKTGFTVSAIQ